MPLLLRRLTFGDVGGYARRHNTFALLSDVANDSTQRQNLVPFTQFPTDLAIGIARFPGARVTAPAMSEFFAP